MKLKPHPILSGLVALVALALSTPTCLSAAPAEPEFSDVFIAGKDQFKSIRIPSVVVTKKGTVLAIAEGRAQHADQANNKLILKRSTDGGRTWGAQQIMADDGENCLNNPCTAVDQNTGRVIVMYQSYPAGFAERDGKIQPGLDGPAIVRNYVVTSDDDGVTWSQPLDVTRTTKTPERVTILASGPGIGIQLTRGPHKGRILIPFNEGPFHQWNVLAVYSDDGGKNWKLGQPAPGCRVPDGKGGEIMRFPTISFLSTKWSASVQARNASSKIGRDGIMNFVSISAGGLADWGFGIMRDHEVPLHLIFGVFASAAVVSVVLVLLIRPRAGLESNPTG